MRAPPAVSAAGALSFERLARHLGFEPARLAFTLRTAAGSGMALLLGGLLGLDHPQWAAMTVWIAAQPLRGHLIEKSLYRLLGTAAGAAYGVTLVALGHGSPAVLVPGLALWAGLCAGAGQLLRGFASYGTLLAGYSAAMVALLDASHPTHIAAFGLDRLLTIGLGVVVALAVSLRFAARPPADALHLRMRTLCLDRLRELAAWARTGVPLAHTARDTQLAELARLEEGLELQVAGRLDSRREVRALRQALTAQVGLLLWWPGAQAPARADGAALADALQATLDAAVAGRPVGPSLLQAATVAEAQNAELAAVLRRLGAAAGSIESPAGGAGARAPSATPSVAQPQAAFEPTVVLHRDWIAARETFLRSVLTLGLIGGLWLATGWPAAPLLMLGVAVMTTLFSTADDPARIMRSVFCGQLLGAAAALAVQALLWPWVDGALGRLLMCLPLVLAGAFVLAHPRTARFGFDFNLVGLLLLQPMHARAFAWPTGLAEAAAVVAGPLVALAAFRLVFPPGGRRRYAQLSTLMQAEVSAMAAQPQAWRRAEVWRARLQHRVLRLVRCADAAGLAPEHGARQGLAVLATGQAVLALGQLLAQDALPPADRRRAQAWLRRLARPMRSPAQAHRRGRLLARDALRLGPPPAGHASASALQHAARVLARAA
ncbi:MAG: FUSC family protein [Pseudacidovorax sp.]|uniref:FUSC family protein n=1 Tax=Pseudacidovorax sp. TaxID=1934311 RepID=UPI001B4FAFFB|nr:FUSC family protein [Pseudacidovorax sp.]MBP6893420.1 FUSC family protein [Pseudacidovorax sp.]